MILKPVLKLNSKQIPVILGKYDVLHGDSTYSQTVILILEVLSPLNFLLQLPTPTSCLQKPFIYAQ